MNLHIAGVSTSMTASQAIVSLTVDNIGGEEIQCQLQVMTLGHTNA